MKHNNVILRSDKSLDANYMCKDATNFHLWNGNKNCFEWLFNTYLIFSVPKPITLSTLSSW